MADDTDRNRSPRSTGDAEDMVDVIGEPGLESALGRDRSRGELPRDMGTNQDTPEAERHVAEHSPPPGSIAGSRVGEQGDPTGSSEETDLHARRSGS